MRDGTRQFALLEPLADVLAHHTGDHDGAAQTHSLHIRRSHGQYFEHVILGRQTAADGQVGHIGTTSRQLLTQFVGHGLQVHGGYAPLDHHAPGAHARAAGGPVYGQEIYARIRGPLEGHSQFSYGVSPCLERDSLGPKTTQALHFSGKALFVNKAKTRVTLELLQGTILVGFLDRFVRRIGRDKIATPLKLQGAFQGIHFDLPTYALGPLTPLEFDGLHPQLADGILGHAEACVLDVHLNVKIAIALVPTPVDVDAPAQVGRLDDLALVVQFQARIDTTNVFATGQHDTRNRRAHSKVLPVSTRHLRGA